MSRLDICRHFADTFAMKFTERKTESGKVHEGTFGNVTMKIYERTRRISRRGKRTRTLFEVVDYTEGRRQFRGFSTFDAAAQEAERLAKLIATGQTAAATLRNADAASFGRALELLRGIDAPLELVAAHYAKAHKILGGDRIVEAAKDFVRRNPLLREPRTVSQVAVEMIELQTKRNKSDRYVEDLRGRLARFVSAFGANPTTVTKPDWKDAAGKDTRNRGVDIANVTTADVQTWLDGMKAAPRSVKNFRDSANSLFKFAEARGYIAKGENPVTGTQKIATRNSEPITIYTPTELHRLIAAAPKWFKPVIALQAFAGLRSAEVMRLDWRNVKLERGHIELGADKTKTATRRLVPITPNLAEWLAPHALKSGKVFSHSRAYFHEAQRDTAAATEIKTNSKKNRAALAAVDWKHNALRHSFISYRVAGTADVPRVALESGNSPAMIFAHYRELVTADDAKNWFAIAPDQAANVVPIAAARK
jgi:integrase